MGVCAMNLQTAEVSRQPPVCPTFCAYRTGACRYPNQRSQSRADNLPDTVTTTSHESSRDRTIQFRRTFRANACGPLVRDHQTGMENPYAQAGKTVRVEQATCGYMNAVVEVDAYSHICQLRGIIRQLASAISSSPVDWPKSWAMVQAPSM